MRGSGEERGEVQRAGEGHYCICMCAQAPQSPESVSCWAEKEFHQNWHARINLTRGMLESKAGSELPGLVSEVLVAKTGAPHPDSPESYFGASGEELPHRKRRKGACLPLPPLSLLLVVVRMSGMLSRVHAEATPEAHLVTLGGGTLTCFTNGS